MMTEQHCQKYKASRLAIRNSEPAYLRSFFNKLMPDAGFKFITFENGDYRNACLTFLFCKEIPDTVTIDVEYAIDIYPAIRAIITLNPRMQWESAVLLVPRHIPATGLIQLQLLPVKQTMYINAGGVLERM